MLRQSGTGLRVQYGISNTVIGVKFLTKRIHYKNEGIIMTSSFRKIVFFILLAGLAVVGYHYMIKPANKDLAEAKGKVDTKLAQLAKFEEAASAAEDLAKQLEKLQEAIEFERCCSTEFDPLDFIETELGSGRVKSATEKKRSVEVELLY